MKVQISASSDVTARLSVESSVQHVAYYSSRNVFFTFSICFMPVIKIH